MSETEKNKLEEGPQHYRLHGAPDNANLVVRMLLEELGAAYDVIPVDRRTSAQKTDAYRRLNPQGLIPVLECPGQDAPVFETGAILLLLSERHQSFAPSTSASGRGRFLKWLFFLSNTLHSDLRISFKPHRYLSGDRDSAAFSEGLKKRISHSFQLLEQELAVSEGPFLLGSQLTCLDFYAAACARWAQIYGTAGRWPLEDYPCLMQLLQRLESRPAIQKACELERIEGAPFTRPVQVSLAQEF
ncbi:glutathione S-transferase family protein [uncultured Roseibium sp.]|uniref:glutathione S-transferase family protein n=1 Tax=uncultured Roseibium sp. TaxID=1936171 RepID=UPI00260278DC|nr:glutathione S-transferase family protein [uncultured Roseibium sp.]